MKGYGDSEKHWDTISAVYRASHVFFYGDTMFGRKGFQISYAPILNHCEAFYLFSFPHSRLYKIGNHGIPTNFPIPINKWSLRQFHHGTKINYAHTNIFI